MKKRTTPKCLHCTNTDIKSRGMCNACYQAAYQSVLAGKTTWKMLEQQGMCSKSTSPRTGFTIAFKAYEAKQK